MSHEIRTPMNAIVGFSKLALETELDRKQHEYLTSISNAAENLLTLVSDVLDFSKIEAGKLTLEKRPFKLADTLGEVARLFRTEIRKRNLELVIDDCTGEHEDFPASGVLIGDALRLQQVLVNLVGNAVKFTARGNIRVSAEVVARNGRALILRLSVRDTGIGINSEQLGRLFDSFEQAETSTTRRYGGTGLGLTICKRLVEVMGGTIEVTSAPGEGSCFAFTAHLGLPKDTDSLPTRKRALAASGLRERRVLVAEDNPINQQLALEFLKRAGARVDIAETGHEAVTRANREDYDVVLMDIHMPELDGLAATRLLREQGYRVPIVAVSADALSSSQTAASEAGCDAYVVKPIDFDVLLATLTPLLPAEADVNLGRRASDREPAAELPALPTPEVEETVESPPPVPLRRVPGIDVGAAIRGHNGNVPLMIRLMGDFGRYYGDAGSRMRSLVQSEDYAEAERLAHNLHGVAGSFGAARLKEASKLLELDLAGAQGEGDDSSLLGRVQSFESALTEVLESAAALAADEVRFRASDYGVSEADLVPSEPDAELGKG